MLPNFLNPFLIPHERFKRLGSKYDGGYVVDIDAVYKTKNLISFGICDNWDFEIDFINQSNVSNIKLFDNQTSTTFFLKRIINSILKLDFKNFIRNIFKLFDFLKIKKYYTQAFIGIGKDELSLEKILKMYNYEKDVYLKCDIEGSEYRILDQILNYQTIFTGIVMEFHDVDLHLERIEAFVSKLELNICHIHANNYSKIINGIPQVVEITFTRETSSKRGLYIKFDSPNNKDNSDYNLKFNND